MDLVADAHVHLYPCYALDAALDAVTEQLERHRDAAIGAFLVERAECDYFEALASHREEVEIPRYTARHNAGDAVLQLEREGGRPVYLFAGRQINAREGVEVLGLLLREHIPDGLPAGETIKRITDAGGVPVLGWAPGKWLFKRRDVIRALLDRAEPGRLLCGDTALRPTWWSEPRLLADARERGFGVLAGSDPLPFGGDERRIGSYYTRIEGMFDPERAEDSVRQALCTPHPPLLRSGRRCGLLRFAACMVRHRLAK